jgi:enoyl reductase-like protein
MRVVTDDAGSITAGGATLKGHVNAYGNSTVVTFKYGTTKDETGWTEATGVTGSPVTGSTNTAVSKAITGLTTKTVYYYRVKGVATVSGESVTVYGIKRSFKTI